MAILLQSEWAKIPFVLPLVHKFGWNYVVSVHESNDDWQVSQNKVHEQNDKGNSKTKYQFFISCVLRFNISHTIACSVQPCTSPPWHSDPARPTQHKREARPCILKGHVIVHVTCWYVRWLQLIWRSYTDECATLQEVGKTWLKALCQPQQWRAGDIPYHN